MNPLSQKKAKLNQRKPVNHHQQSYMELWLSLNSVHSDCYSYKIFTKDQLRVIAKTSEAYKDIIDLIRKNGVIGHTFTQKEKGSCRIVIKNLHHTTPKNAIFDEIEKTGYTSIVRGEIVCAISRRNKKPLNIFFPNVELGPNNPHLNA